MLVLQEIMVVYPAEQSAPAMVVEAPTFAVAVMLSVTVSLSLAAAVEAPQPSTVVMATAIMEVPVAEKATVVSVAQPHLHRQVLLHLPAQHPALQARSKMVVWAHPRAQPTTVVVVVVATSAALAVG